MYTVVKEHLKPVFNEYELIHKIEVFDSEIDDFRIKEAEDHCSITDIGNDRFIILYDVTGRNYHSGGVSGTGKYKTRSIQR